MESAPSFHPLDYVFILRRRFWWLVVPVVLAVVVGIALVQFLPRTYKGTATLGISLAAISPELLSNMARVPADERARNISQVLYSPTVLQRVVREQGLDKEMALEAAMNEVKSRIEVMVPKPSPNMPPASMDQFFLSATDDTPRGAQRLTNRLADVFVQESSRKREVRAEETSAFLGKQLETSQARLSELEARLRVAKESFMGALPEQTNANLTMATGLQQQLETTANTMRGEQDRLSMVERQIDAMKQGAQVELLPGAPMTGSAAAVRVVQLERELAVALGNYTDKHPEVVRLKEELAMARATAEAEKARPEADRLAGLSVDPAYRSLLADRERVRLRMRDLERQDQQLRTQIAMYRTRVESAPRVEQQIATLQREYELERQQYAELTSKKRNAEISENLIRNNGTEEFTVLSHATLPLEPFSPNMQRLLVVAILLGVCLGGGLAVAREYLDRSIHDARALNDIDLPVLGEIPRIASQV
jgi:polysaccharide chain length determinant protein (PEP-CTERM system associated)